jgi:hypothetical protein
MFKLLGIAILLYLPFGIALQVVGNLPFFVSAPVIAAVLRTELWLVLRYHAKGEPDKLAKADRWNPVNVAKTSARWVKDRTGNRRNTGNGGGHGPLTTTGQWGNQRASDWLVGSTFVEGSAYLPPSSSAGHRKRPLSAL